MRSEKEMLDLIMNTAREDDRIRAVIMNGSRANPNAPRDTFQDYDIVYMVSDPAPFHKNLEWIKKFGELMILQMPEGMHARPPQKDDSFVYLMQFMDGNRIDLNIVALARLNEILQDSLSVMLLDKDGIIPPFGPPDERDYLPTSPTLKEYNRCCNEFWWVSTYVAKGLWRNEILYALKMYEMILRVELMKILTWLIGKETNFEHNPGKHGKYMQNYLDPTMWDLLLKTYPQASIDEIWIALFTMCDLFRTASIQVAGHFGYEYPQEDDQRVTAHLHRVRDLPPDAKEIY
ncbi:MAG: aminoglycoside adenylyltransferase [Chloroflexota bacterium]|nr:MAG: aminoglycoside adenylyltransferase [Chloroflexota bacterium]